MDEFNDVGILLQEHLCDYCYLPHRYFLFYYIPFTAYNFASISAAEISEEEKYQVRWLSDTLSSTSLSFLDDKNTEL